VNSRLLVRDGIHWEMEGVTEAGARALFAWVAGSRGIGTVVKSNRVRTVARIPVGAGDLYLKHDPYRGFFASLRFLVTPSRARAEWNTMRRLIARKIPTVRPLAVGERRWLGVPIASYLVTEGVKEAEPLDKRLRAGRMPPAGRPRGRWRRQVARSLAEIVAAFHRDGLWHRDLHLGNFLAQPLGDAGLALRLIDLSKARAPRHAGPRQWIFDLAWLDYGARPWVTRTDRLRFLRAYLREMPGWEPQTGTQQNGGLGRSRWKRAARAVARASEARAQRHRARRLRRAGRGGALFVEERQPWGRLRRPEDVDPARIAAAVRRAGSACDAEVIRETARARVSRVQLDGGASLCVKRYRPRGLPRRDRGRAAWVAAEGCRMREIETPRALALVDRIPGERGSAFVMEDLGHLPWLTHTAALRLRSPGVPRRRRADFARAVGAWVRRLHAEGVRHADLKAGNVLVRDTPTGPRFVLLDLEDVDFPGSLSPADRERALAQLNASLPGQVGATDRLRAFRAYAHGGIFGDAASTRASLARVVRKSLARRHLWGKEARPWRPEPEGFGAAVLGAEGADRG
jgi:tRNA A-37 threonylcarbamoyl transferase component Bud32